jgi:phosphate transport system substrate-binding protein
MSRDWEPDEIDKFKAAHNYQPTIVPTCIDMLAVYVHKDNPIKGLSLQQVDAIFSKGRKGGYPRDIKTWGDAGLTDPAWVDKPITLYGRNTTSGTYKYFKDNALFKGTFKDNYQERPGSSGVIGAISSDRYGIGFSGIGYTSAGVRVVPLGVKDDGTFVPAEPKFAYDESYPLARYLYISFKHKPGEPLDPLRREFLKFVLSKQGQALVLKDSYLPLPAEEAAEVIKTLDAKP